MKPMRIKLIILSCIIANFVKAQEVEVVLSAGLDWATSVAISDNNRFVAKTVHSNVSIWDLKTGRMLRNVTFTDDAQVPIDSMWFTKDNQYVVLSIMQSNDQFKVQLDNGKSERIVGAAYDWSNYVYTQSNYLKSTTHLYTKDKSDLKFKSPDGKKTIIYRKVDNPYANKLMPYAYQILVKKNGKTTPPLDTCYTASFVYSADSRYLFANQSIYDLETQRKVTDLYKVESSWRACMFLPDSRIPVSSGIGTVRIWDFPDVKNIEVAGIINFVSSVDGRFIICERYNEEKEVKEYLSVDLKRKKVLNISAATKESGRILDVSADGSLYAFIEQSAIPGTYDMNYVVKVVNRVTNKVEHSIKNTTKSFFTADNNYMIIDSIGSYSLKYDLTTKKSYKFPTEGVSPGTSVADVSIDHQYLMGSETDVSVKDDKNNWLATSKVKAWDSESGKVVFECEVKGYGISGIEVSKDHRYIAFGSAFENTVFVYNFQSGEEVFALKGHTGQILKTAFSDDGDRLISSSFDGSRRVWNLEKGHEMVSLISTGPEDYAIVTPQQYYYSTRGAQKLIHFVKGLEIFPFAQFDLKYNRPDIIIQNMEASNQDMIKPFNLAYKKRLKRLGFTEEMLSGEFHVPVVSITNEDLIPITSTANTVSLNIKAVDEKYKLDRLIVRVNEVPLNGKMGIDLKDKNTGNVEDIVNVELSSGKNRISVSVLNEKGVESLATNITVDYSSESSTPNLYLFTIGASKYQQSQFDLSYAAKDAQDIQQLFSTAKTPFNKIISRELTNDQVTLEAVQELKKELSNSTVNDVVCLFFAGHGILDVNLNYFLASYDIDFNDPGSKGIPYEALEDLMDDIPARRKLIMIDACHSGEIDKDEVALIEGEGGDTSEEDISFRSVTSTSLKRVGLNNSFELMKELFTDIRKSSGTVIISSAGGMEYAMEGGDWNNGVFTYCFINGIKNMKADLNKDGLIMLSEMNLYVRDEVFDLTSGRQQPTNRAEVAESDWRLW